MRRGAGVIGASVGVAALAGVFAADAGALRLVRVAAGLSNPVHVASTGSERGRLYVVEQRGVIKVVERGRVRSTPFLDIRDLVSSGGERGLFSLAFHPAYATNRRAYVNYTNRAGDTRVVELRANTRRTRLLRRSARVVLAVDQPYSNHNGGGLAFGPNGGLYVALGDGGGAGDPGNRAQSMRTRLGKLLRINVDVAPPRVAVVGLGLRNPWRFSFDRKTGNLWIADVGQNAWEEIDFVRRRSAGLENFGWRRYEGRHLYDGGTALRRPSKLVWPVHEYSHRRGCSVTGGFVYRGPLTGPRGRYFFGDYCSGAVWSFRYANGTKSAFRRERFIVPGLSSFGEGPAGGLYLVASWHGHVYRLARG